MLAHPPTREGVFNRDILLLKGCQGEEETGKLRCQLVAALRVGEC